MSPARIIRSIASVATKEFLHILRDWRILILILTLPPAFTLLLGHAFEVTDIMHAPALLHDADRSEESAKLRERLLADKSFAWRQSEQPVPEGFDLLRNGVRAALVIPKGWGRSLSDGQPQPLRVILDGTDTSTAPQLEGSIREVLGEFQLAARDEMIDNLPDEVFELGKKLSEDTRKKFTSWMEPWEVKTDIRYNPGLKFIDFVTPGIVGLILQLLTVTLMACTIARERESGTLSQLLVSPLHRTEIVAGKVLPYLVVSILLISMTLATAHFHFRVQFHGGLLLSLICLLFLLCSLGTGLLISTFCQTQAQAIQFAVFYLLPVFPLSGAFATLEQLPEGVRHLSQLFPLTHFCHAFRMVNLAHSGFMTILPDLAFLLIGAVVTCTGAALLLRRIQD
ncbi:MAG: ABC transporter permease [Chthoniobacteraceae bacterium]